MGGLKAFRRSALCVTMVLCFGCGEEDKGEPVPSDEEDVSVEDTPEPEPEDVVVEDEPPVEDVPREVEEEETGPETPCEIEWVEVGDYEIFAYEASRVDAAEGSQGAEADFACSRAGVIPWTDVDWDTAGAACAAIGARLCRGSEWDIGCRGANRGIFPYGQTYDPDVCNVLESPDGCLEGACRVVPTGTYTGCVSEHGVFDMSGNVGEWVEDQRPFGDEAYDVRGGSYLSANDNTIKCRNANLSRARDFTNPDLGFRCCR